jgi:hypothetical protein
MTSTKRRVAGLIAATGTAGVITVLGVTDAWANGPDRLPPNASAVYPTWVFQNTKLCATNSTPASHGLIKIKALAGGSDPEYLPVPGGTTRCVSRWWAGNPVMVTNIGRADLSASSQ